MIDTFEMKMEYTEIEDLLEQRFRQYNNISFIENDPVSIPHTFKSRQDREISGFFAAILAWGQRKTIIRKTAELMALMDNAPYQFILGHTEKDLKRFLEFKHRTFNATDTLYFIHFLQHWYSEHPSLESAFNGGINRNDPTVENGLIHFHNLFFSLEHSPGRSRKHIATPARNSACKRLNMFLRWMVRKDERGVDFGLWDSIRTDQLVCPCDLHVDRVARLLGLIKSRNTNWATALELTENLKSFDPADPVKYDFALFGLGVEEKLSRF